MDSPPITLVEAFSPPPALPVSDILEWRFIPQRPGSRKFSLAPLEWFSERAPTIEDLQAEAILLPPTSICKSLVPLLEAGGSGSYRSIQDPVRSEVYLPMWIARVWRDADTLVHSREVWQGRLLWAETTAVREKWSKELLANTLEAIRCSPWTAGFRGLQRGMVSIAHLGRTLLSHKWLDDEVIDCISDTLRIEMSAAVPLDSVEGQATKTKQDGLTKSPLIASSHLRTCLLEKNSGLRQFYSQRLISGEVTRLLLPCNLQNIHWVPAEIDVTHGHIYLGDSKPRASQEHVHQLVQDIRTWLDEILPGRTWRTSMTALETGLQQDSSSCGLATVNAIERRVSPLASKWTPSAPGKTRARYFIRCVQAGRAAPDGAANSGGRNVQSPNCEPIPSGELRTVTLSCHTHENDLDVVNGSPWYGDDSESEDELASMALDSNADGPGSKRLPPPQLQVRTTKPKKIAQEKKPLFATSQIPVKLTLTVYDMIMPRKCAHNSPVSPDRCKGELSRTGFLMRRSSNSRRRSPPMTVRQTSAGLIGELSAALDV
ncbi:hypothetical protein FKP32DRAFT_1356491 [Trametes sanguinea]|nr:hypothetical protein FKP32DRAFT_1356491 [Trametes sanguinea]